MALHNFEYLTIDVQLNHEYIVVSMNSVPIFVHELNLFHGVVLLNCQYYVFYKLQIFLYFQVFILQYNAKPYLLLQHSLLS